MQDLLLSGQRVSVRRMAVMCGRSEEGHGPYCTQSEATVVAVTAECVLCMCMCMCTAVYTKQVSMCLRRHKIVRFVKTLRQTK